MNFIKTMATTNATNYHGNVRNSFTKIVGGGGYLSQHFLRNSDLKPCNVSN